MTFFTSILWKKALKWIKCQPVESPLLFISQTHIIISPLPFHITRQVIYVGWTFPVLYLLIYTIIYHFTICKYHCNNSLPSEWDRWHQRKSFTFSILTWGKCEIISHFPFNTYVCVHAPQHACLMKYGLFWSQWVQQVSGRLAGFAGPFFCVLHHAVSSSN